MDDLGVRPILRNPYGDCVEGLHQQAWLDQLEGKRDMFRFPEGTPTITRMMSVHDAEWSKRCAAYHTITHICYILYYIYMCVLYTYYIYYIKKGLFEIITRTVDDVHWHTHGMLLFDPSIHPNFLNAWEAVAFNLISIVCISVVWLTSTRTLASQSSNVQIYNVLISFDRTGCQRETIRTSHSRKKLYISFPLLWMIHICRGCNWIHYGKEQMDNFPRQRCKSARLLRPFRVYPQSTWRSCWNPSTTKGDCAWFDPPDGRAMGTHGMPGPMWCRDLAQEHLGSALLHPEGTVEVLLWQLSWHVMVKKKCLSHCFGLEPMWVWVNTYRYIFSGMNIHKSQLFWCELQGYQGFDPSPCVKLCETLHQFMFLWKVWLEIGGLLLSFPGMSGVWEMGADVKKMERDRS